MKRSHDSLISRMKAPLPGKTSIIVKQGPASCGQFNRRLQAITWTNVELSSKVLCGIPLRAISQEIPKISISDVSLKITNFRLQRHAPWVN